MCKVNFTPFPLLTTERLTLRQLMHADDSEIFVLRSIKEVNGYLDRPIARTFDDASQFIDKINGSILKNESIYWVIAFKDQSNLFRTICLWNISEDETIAGIGFELLPKYRGKQIMQEVLPIAIGYGFETMGLNSIEGEVDLDNFKSIKLMEKNDFIFLKK